MKKNLIKFCWLSLIAFQYSNSAFAAENYTLDPQHTYILWHADHFGFSNPSGKWMANGTLQLDKDKPENSQVKVDIKVGDIITGIPDLDKHLKGKLFFDVEQFPTATFVSNKVETADNKISKVHGVLTLHGISKPITLNVQPNKMGVNPVSNKETAGFTGHAEIKRSDFGITTLLPGVGDDVKLEIQVEASKEK